MKIQCARERGGSCAGAASRRSRTHYFRASLAAAGLIGVLGLGACSSGSSGFESADSTQAPAAAGAKVVAMLETSATSLAEFNLRGTVPVPPGTYQPGSQVPFSVLDWDGTAVSTQVQLVTWYPKAADGADVVEVLARVHTPPSATPGQKISYRVVQNPHTTKKFRLTKDALQVADQAKAVLLVARDVYGNRYTLDLFANGKKAYKLKTDDVLRDGEIAATVRTHGVVTPDSAALVGKPGGPLHHLFGVHAYTTFWVAESAVSLDVRVHNGLSGHDKTTALDDPNAALYFKDIEVWIPKGWKLFQQSPDPGLGTPYDSQTWTVYPLVAARSDGKMHFMPQQAQFHRRLTIAPALHAAAAKAIGDEAGRAFCKAGPSPTGGELWSWWNPQTARYFPMRYALPDLAFLGEAQILAKDQKNLATLRQVVATGKAGSFPTDNAQLGWAHPWGSKYGGMTGGSEIQQHDGVTTAWAASVDGYRYSQLTHRMYSDRQCDVLFNLDGDPTQIQDWLLQGPAGPYIPMNFSQTLNEGNDPFGLTKADTSHVSYVKTKGLQPPYETELAGFMPIDFQHYTRYTRSAKVLAWLGNDPLAKDDVLMRAEIFRLSYSLVHNSATGSNPSGMMADYQHVQSYPGLGFAFGRGEGWGIDIMNAAYSMADSKWRSEARPWFGEVVDLVAQGQSNCNGFIQSLVSEKMLDGKYATRQAIEQGIVENGLRGAIESVFRNVDSARTAQTEYTLEKSFYAMIGPMAWSDSMKGPHSYLAVGPLDKSKGAFCGSIPSDGADNGVNFSQAYGSFAYAYEITGDQQFLAKASQAFSAPNPSGLLSAIEKSGFNLLDSRAPLIACCQLLGL